MASAGKKKQDELNLKTLRELTSLDHNKKCLECGQRGITYADMTTAGFVCVQCSGYLRGINPPHRVKSISMTSFTEKEIDQLKEGGNEVARKIWMGTWNPSKDREPDKKDEQAFKQFLISKYERRSWYKSPSEVVKSEPAPSPKVEPKIEPPPASKASARPHAAAAVAAPQPVIQTCTAPAQPTPSTVVATPTTSGTKPDLLGDLGGDPFAPKKPAGAVAVMMGMGGAAPLLPGTSKPEEFGAFTGASGNLGSSSSGSLTLQPSNTTSSSGDKYAELASLDSTMKVLRLKDEPSPSLPRAENTQSNQGFGGSGFGGPAGSTNPFASPPSSAQGIAPASGVVGQAQSNPFVTAGGVQGPGGMQFGGGVAGVGGFQQAPGQLGGPQMQQQQQQRFPGPGGFGAQPGGQQFPQQQGQQQWGMMQQQQQQPPQQQGFGMQQPQQQQQWGSGQPGMQQQWGAPQQGQFGGGMPQQGFGGGAAGFGGGGGGGMQAGGFGGAMQQQGGAGFGGMQPQQVPNQQFGGGFANQQQGQQQMQQPAQPQKPQFDWSSVNVTDKKQPNQYSWSSAPVSQAPQAPPPKKYINWGGGANRVDNNPSSGSFVSSSPSLPRSTAPATSTGSDGGGWSSSLTKPAPAPSWSTQQPAQSAAPANTMGWSAGVAGGAPSSGFGQQQQPATQQGSGFGGGFGQQGGGAQQGSGFGGGSFGQQGGSAQQGSGFGGGFGQQSSGGAQPGSGFGGFGQGSGNTQGSGFGGGFGQQGSGFGGGFGQQGSSGAQQGSGFGGGQVGNPFASMSSQQQSGTTNPFL